MALTQAQENFAAAYVETGGRMAHEINGAFDQSDEETKNLVMEIVSMFHHRNCVHQEDGSRGEIKITPRQLNDALAYVAKCKAE